MKIQNKWCYIWFAVWVIVVFVIGIYINMHSMENSINHISNELQQTSKLMAEGSAALESLICELHPTETFIIEDIEYTCYNNTFVEVK